MRVVASLSSSLPLLLVLSNLIFFSPPIMKTNFALHCGAPVVFLYYQRRLNRPRSGDRPTILGKRKAGRGEIVLRRPKVRYQLRVKTRSTRLVFTAQVSEKKGTQAEKVRLPSSFYTVGCIWIRIRDLDMDFDLRRRRTCQETSVPKPYLWEP